MRFMRIRLENWRNFQQVDVPVQARAFLVGPNASGKSNLLDALRFLQDVVVPGGGFEKAVTSRGGVSRLRSLFARRQPDVAIEVWLGDDRAVTWRYRLAFGQDSQRRPLLREERVWRGEEQVLQRPDAQDGQDQERLRQTHLEQTFANQPFRLVAEFFASILYYHLVPQLIRQPERYSGPGGDPFGADFLERVAATSTRTRDTRLRRIQEALRVAAPQLSELKLERDERGNPHLKGNYEHWRPRGAWQTESDFSDGTLRLMGLLWAALEGNGPLLLEEPELSLHPGIVRHIPQMLHRVLSARRRQVILSTHSSELLRDPGIAADEVLLFIPGREGSEVRCGADMAEVARLLQAGLSAAEAALPLTEPDHASQLALWE